MHAENGVNAKARAPPALASHGQIPAWKQTYRAKRPIATGRPGMSPGSARLHVGVTGAIINT